MVLGGRLLAGRYQLDAPVGTGWFSEVWRATDTALSRPVAVKLLHPAYARQPEALARFRAGARHAAALWHQNIAHIYDYDEPAEGPPPYLVMELVDGPCLAGVLADGPLDAARTMDVVAQAAAGLQAAHAKGLVHRDIKPGNLLLASSGTVKIIDWGISQAIGSAPSTVSGIVPGTAEYLAPERIAGAQAGPASDLYALGVLAYECLGGAPPFVGEPPEVARAHRDHPVPPLPGSVPADVSALVMQLVAKDPARRPVSAAEVVHRAGRLREDLRDGSGVAAGRTPGPLAAPAAVTPPPVLASAGVAADARWQLPAASGPASRARTGARRRRRRPVPVLAFAAIAGLITVVLAVTVGAAVSRHPASALPSAPPRHSASGTVAAPPARPPSSASPSRKARRPGPGHTGMVQMAASDHRTVTAPGGGREKIRRHRHGKDAGHGHGNHDGNGHGNRDGHGHDNRNGNAPVHSVLGKLPAEFWHDGKRASTQRKKGPDEARSSVPEGSGHTVWQLVGADHEVLLSFSLDPKSLQRARGRGRPERPGQDGATRWRGPGRRRLRPVLSKRSSGSAPWRCTGCVASIPRAGSQAVRSPGTAAAAWRAGGGVGPRPPCREGT